jgi:biotin carboxylase
MNELIGFAELTPYRGGWCGNEVFADDAEALWGPDIRRQAYHATLAIGAHLQKVGYWGYFGLDFLLDQDTGALYLGELNPRMTGATPLTTQAAADQHSVPLLVWHLLEGMGVEYALEVEQYNHCWLTAASLTSWSQMILESTTDTVEVVTQVPASGIWRMEDNGTVHFARQDFQPQAISSDAEAFFLRTIEVGQYQSTGVSLGRLVLRGRMTTPTGQLNERARAWIRGLRAHFAAHPVLAGPTGADTLAGSAR